MPRSRMVSAGALTRTSVFQPVLTALCVGIVRELADCGIRPDIVAGHSLGELAASVSAGALHADAAVAVAATRGRLMERETALHPGGMIALAPCDRATADALVAAGRIKGTASLAAHNAKDRWVVAGDWPALREIESRTATTRLPVAGAWHSPAMAGGAAEYRDALRPALTTQLTVPLVSNRSGAAVPDVAALVELLVDQLTHCVRWAESMAYLQSSGVSEVFICGPGKVLRQFVELGIPGAVVHVVAWPEDLARLDGALVQ